MNKSGSNPRTRTSQTDPLRIAQLDVGSSGGAIGVTFAPGKKQSVAMTGAWERDLATDLAAIRAWGASELVTLLEPAEFEELGVAELPDMAREYGLMWHGLPITDGAAPDERFLIPWEVLEPELIGAMYAGKRVVVHCKGGLGRAGTVACLLLMSSRSSDSAAEAIARVRTVRPGAVETVEQEEFIRSWALQPRDRMR